MTDWLFGVTPGQLALLLGLCALIVVAAGICVAVYGWYTRRTMRRLERMLEQAIAGSFEQGNYSEARLSRLEEKLSRFLRSSQLSRKSIEEDRGRIKSLDWGYFPSDQNPAGKYPALWAAAGRAAAACRCPPHAGPDQCRGGKAPGF